MTDPYAIIEKFYSDNPPLKETLLRHSEAVRDKALAIVERHAELRADREFVAQAALLHDIGIFLTDAPGIHCHGRFPYIAHGYLGADLLRAEGLERHALVCERHTGTGLSLELILEKNLPVPHRDLQPISTEEKIICFADKFFSKTHLNEEFSLEKVREKMKKIGGNSLEIFNSWCEIFL